MSSEKLKNICELFWLKVLELSPEFALYRGFRDNTSSLDMYDKMTHDKRKVVCEDIMEQLIELDNAKDLADCDKVTHQLLKHYIQTYVKGLVYDSHCLVISFYEGPEITFTLRALPKLNFGAAQDYSLYIERLQSYPKSIFIHTLNEVYRLDIAFVSETSKPVESAIESLREGMRTGIMPHALSVGEAVERIDRIADSRMEDLQLYSPFLNIPSHIKGADELRKDAQKLFSEKIIPVLKRYRDFIKNEYILRLRPSISIDSIPGPKGRYAAMLRFYCDDDITPQQMHDIGLNEIRNITARIDQITKQLKFEGSLRDFATFLHDKEEFKFNSGEEVLEYCESFYKDKILPRVCEFFKFSAEQQVKFTLATYASPSKAEYNAPSYDGSKPAVLRLATMFHENFPKYDVPTLMMHETEPGHHLQACYAMRNHDLPMFRRVKDDRYYSVVPGRFPMNSAYTEGWGLYCEELGEEWGVYEDPYSVFGFLAGQLDRSVRMVIDTGIHAFNWSKERCVEFMLQNTCMSLAAIHGEIKRYIYIPGQACCYVYGYKKFIQLRAKAQQILGPKFHMKEFHDAVLSCGQVPLNILETIVSQYIENTSKSEN